MNFSETDEFYLSKHQAFSQSSGLRDFLQKHSNEYMMKPLQSSRQPSLVIREGA
jgi:hypothetical protein